MLHGTTAPNSAGKSHFEVIDFAVSLNETGFAIFSADADAVFHTDDAVPALSMKVLEDILVIDFTTGRLLAPRIVTRLKIGNFVPAHIDIGNEIPLGDLLVVDIEEDLARRGIHSLTDGVCLI